MNLTGRELGPYRIGPELGRGGMGTVYRAKTLVDGPCGDAGSVVAVKVFHPEHTADEVTFQRFQREAELGMKIRHAHVVQTYEIGSAEIDGDAYHFMAMEIVEGQTLRELLLELGTLPDHLIYQVAEQSLDALEAVHAENMIHRDVKPENIVLTREHKVLMMDLGVARLQQEGRDLTRAGEFVGSIAYASPEQFLDQDHVGPSADLYAFGVVMYEMATGRNPFGGAELSTLITQKVQGTVRRPRLVQRDLDPFLEEVILTCLKKDEDERFASCGELRAVLREGEASAWWQERIKGDAFPAAARALARIRPARALPLIGRGAALDLLHDALERARDGRGGVALVEGAAGAGKSRLIHDFAEELVAPDGPAILAGLCPEETARPFQAFAEAVRDILGDEAQLEARLNKLVPALAPLVPALRGSLLGTEPRLDNEGFATCMPALLRALAAERPLVLVIEDLNRAGPDELELFSQVARQASEMPLLLVATLRGDEIEEGSELHSLRTAIAQRAETTVVEVGPLDRGTTDELIGAFVKHRRTVRALGRPLFERSDGNPRIVLEMLAHLVGQGVLVDDDGGMKLARPVADAALPQSIRQLFAEKLLDLDDDQRECLAAAAVQGVVFNASELGAVLGQRKIRLLKRLAVLERKFRVIESSGKNSFRFAGSGLRHAVYEGIPDERRKELHRAYAESILEDLEDEDEDGDGATLDGATAFALARHRLEAGLLAEAGPELELAIEHAAGHQHPAHGAAFLERVVRELPDGADALRFEARMRLADVYEMLGRSAAWKATLEAARDEAQRIGEALPRARVHAGLAAALLRAGRYDAAAEEAKRGQGVAWDAKEKLVEAECLHLLGSVEYRRGEFEACAAHWQDALDQRRAAGDRRGEAASLLALGSVMPEVGLGEQALETKQEALAIYREIGDRRGEGGALNNLGNSFVDAQRLEEALPCYELAVDIARECGDLPAEAAALFNRGRAFAVLARIDDAKDCFERALDIFREIGDPAGEAETLDELGWAIAGFGERDEAVRCLRAARDSAGSNGQNALLARILRHLANVQHEQGEHETAWQLYDKALELARTQARVRLLADMGNSALKEGDFSRAVDLLQQAVDDQDRGSRGLLACCRLARAKKAAGMVTEAVQLAEQAERLIKGNRVAPQHGPEVYYSLGTVLDTDTRGRGYLATANDLLGARTRSIRSIVQRQHYLTMTWPNREILEEARRVQ